MSIRERLFALEAFGVKLGLDNIRAIVAALGHPELGSPTVHIAGTNGKGSVSAMVERGLRAAGHTTGLYTSPHLDRVEERVAINGQMVDALAFDRAAEHVLAEVDRHVADGRLAAMPTFFEVTTSIAFELFKSHAVDIAVIEVGMGGRFDATNVVSPLCTAITSIDFDHERHLGSTLGAIAGEKAGIVKTGVPLVVGELGAEARAVIDLTAEERGATVVEKAAVAAGGLQFEQGRATVAFQTPVRSYAPVTLSLNGSHQVGNAAVAVRVLEIVSDRGIRVDGPAIETALGDTRWPGRLEWLRTDAGTLLIDAAHNPAGATALASYLREAGLAPLPLVFAAMRDKDLDAMIAALAPVVSRFVTSEADSPRACPADVLAERVARVAPHVPVVVEPDPMHAIQAALDEGGRAAAAGSIFFVGPVRARLVACGAVPI